jgi:SPP1 family predicted phage head-tail adaptor
MRMPETLPTINDLRERVELQSREEVPVEDTGNLTETFTTIVTVWARVESFSGGWYIASQQTESVATHRIAVRYRTDYESLKFIRWRGRRFEVRSIREMDPHRRFHELLVEELKSNV